MNQRELKTALSEIRAEIKDIRSHFRGIDDPMADRPKTFNCPHCGHLTMGLSESLRVQLGWYTSTCLPHKVICLTCGTEYAIIRNHEPSYEEIKPETKEK